MPDATPTDLTQRFILENLDIRGQVVRLGPLWQAIVSRRAYPESMLQLLGEFSALAVLIAAGLKHPGRAVLQVMGHGPVSMAVADCTDELALRAMLRVDASFPPLASVSPLAGSSFPRGRESSPCDLPTLFADGRLALTIENHSTARHFQSVVPLEGATLAECFEHYFDRSEQVPTHLWVHATAESVGALILQKLPKADDKDPHGWARVQHLAALNAPLCLGKGAVGEGGTSLALGSGAGSEGVPELLTALFPEDDVRLYKPLPVRDGCTRSQEKVVSMLRSLGRAEVEATLAEHGVVTVNDEICNQEYRFTAPDVARIFAD